MKIEQLFKRELADEPGTDAALRRICMGEPATGNGTPYVWALEILCAHFGQKLPNGSVANADDEWIMRVVDPVFDAWRVGDFVKVKRLVYGAGPSRSRTPNRRAAAPSIPPISRARSTSCVAARCRNSIARSSPLSAMCAAGSKPASRAMPGSSRFTTDAPADARVEKLTAGHADHAACRGDHSGHAAC